MIYIIFYHTHSLNRMLFDLETCTVSHYFMFNFYQINKNSNIQTSDHLVIKILISCKKKKNSIQYLKLLNKTLRYIYIYMLPYVI
jgi:hypothetical protein